MQKDISKAHQKLGDGISKAEKRMFKSHLEGKSLVKCLNTFREEIESLSHEVVGADDFEEIEFVTVTLPNGKQVEMSGDVVEMASAKTTKKEVPYQTIEQWARDCIQGFDEKGEL